MSALAHIKDGVALTKFIYWLKKNVRKIPMTELSVTEKLYSLRKQQENFIGNSFDPIISYGVHAAINHYSATPETDISIEPGNLFWQIPADIITRALQIPHVPLLWDL